MDRRKEELEKKRAKLAELRRAREERKAALLAAQSKDGVVASGANLGREKQDVDDLVASLVGEKRASMAGAGVASPANDRRSSMHSAFNDRMSVTTLVSEVLEQASAGTSTPTGYISG